MKNLLNLALIFVPVLIYGQTQTENYVENTTYQVPVTIENQNTIADDEKIESLTYFDGLGRPKQSISQRVGGKREDLMIPFEYDDFGRRPKEYLPYPNPNTSNDGAYLQNVITPLLGYYDNRYDTDTFHPYDMNAYSENRFEDSPLNRVLETGAPGKDWKIHPNDDSDHTIKLDYQTNSANSVKKYSVTFPTNNTEEPQLSDDGFYNAKALYLNVVKDENWKVSDANNRTNHEFTTKKGQVVLKRAFENNQEHNTYYIYDDFDNLTYVIPPLVDTTIPINNAILNSLCYQYVYDYRNRMVAKKVPAKDWEYILYDKLDRPVLNQDFILRNQGKWLYTKYDKFGRVVYTGLYTPPSGLGNTDIQNNLNIPQTISEERTSTPTDIGGVDVYYTNDAFPGGNEIVEVLTINYYDDYIDTDGMSVPTIVMGTPTTEYNQVTNTTKGLPTVGKVKVIDLPTEHWITTITGYDTKGRPVYVRSKNDYLDTDDTIQSRLDFTGKPTEGLTYHTRSGQAPITTEEYYYYDHIGRLLSHKQKIDNEPLQLIAQNHYDELGQLVKKNVGGQTALDGYTDIEYIDVTFDGSLLHSPPTNPWNWPSKLKTKGVIEVDGGVTYKILQDDELVRVGFVNNSNGNASNDYFDYGIFHDFASGSNSIKVKENGNWVTTSQVYATGDVFKIQRIGNLIRYYKNGVNFKTVNYVGNIEQLTTKVSFNGPGSFGIEDFSLYGNNVDKSLQTIDYQYNIRGWLTDINNVGSPPALGLDVDLFNFKVIYNEEIQGSAGDPGKAVPLYNGNIAQTIWKTSSSDGNKRSYGYQYDALNRITSALSRKGNDLNTIDHHSVWEIEYDLNGNIEKLKRNGDNESGGASLWDDLVYTYSGNQLQSVTDNSVSTQKYKGFNDQNSGVDYIYDQNGNMITDANINITNITYNHLNLPKTISVNVGGQVGTIKYIYDATGVKQAKIFTDAGVNSLEQTTQYAGNYVYSKQGTDSPILQFLSHPEGYIEPTPIIPSNGEGSESIEGFDIDTGQTTFSDYMYVFQYKDHLGNIRLSYADSDLTGSIDPSSEIIEENNYYPFGLKQRGYNYDVSTNGNSLAQQWRYNGKELNEELGLDWYDYGARNYNASLGRWMSIDPLAQDYFNNSPYNYVANTPIVAYDPDGKRIAIVGSREYRAQVLIRLFNLALQSETGAKELNIAIQANETLTIYDPNDSAGDHLEMSDTDSKGNRSVGFDLSRENEKLDADNGRNGEELKTNSSTNLGHEIAHFNHDPGGLLLIGGYTVLGIRAGEVKAMEVENQIRKELGMDERTDYSGRNFHGMTIRDSEFKYRFYLARKKNYAQVAKESKNRINFILGRGLKIQTKELGIYRANFKLLRPQVRKPLPNEELSIEKSN